MLHNVSERMDELDGMYDDIQDRVFEIDKNRRNNLVFYGVKGDEDNGDDCERRIKRIMNTHLRVTREIPLTKVERIWNGPSFRGVKPVQARNLTSLRYKIKVSKVHFCRFASSYSRTRRRSFASRPTSRGPTCT